jgi:hypothetical protein
MYMNLLVLTYFFFLCWKRNVELSGGKWFLGVEQSVRFWLYFNRLECAAGKAQEDVVTRLDS